MYFSICVVTILLLFVFANRVNIMANLKKSVLDEVLYEVTDDNVLLNIENYSIDNPVFFLYISNNTDSFEADFKEYIISNNLSKNIIYFDGFSKLNTSLVSEFKNYLFIDSLKSISTNSLKQSNLYFFKNGKVINILYKEKRSINIDDVANFIESIGE